MKDFFVFSKARKAGKRGVFGLTSVQAFFVIILSLALLAYVIVTVMGTLEQSSIVPTSSLAGRVNNESGFINSTGDFLNSITVPGFTNPAILIVINGSNGAIIPTTNFTLRSDGFYQNSSTSAQFWQNVNITYTYNYNSQAANQVDTILLNTSTGIVNFFTAVNPVYAILAILVIILVLVVLVRVVAGNESFSKSSGAMQL